jgi:HAD superfamily hydrolase (TIGR01490 family)
VPAAAFFDLDRTLIRRSSAAALARPLHDRGVIGRRLLLRSAFLHLLVAARGVDVEELRDAAAEGLGALAGLGVGELREIVAESMDSVLRPLVYAEPLQLLERHRERGERTYVVSGSLQEIVEQVARGLGFDGAVGSICEVVGDCYTGRAERIVLGEEKAVAVRELAVADGLDLAASTAYSDSIADLPFLEAVGHPVVVNPDAALRRVARDRRWPVLEFVELVQPPRARALPVAALAVPFAAGVLVGARRRAA